MQPKIESSELAEFIKFGQTGVLNDDGLYALGCLMESIRDRVAAIADSRAAINKNSWYDYEADPESVTLDCGGFQVRMEHYDRCDGTQYDTEYVSFGDFLNDEIMEKIAIEKKAAEEKKRREEATRKAAAARKVKEAQEEKAAFERFKQWEKENGKS